MCKASRRHRLSSHLLARRWICSLMYDGHCSNHQACGANSVGLLTYHYHFIRQSWARYRRATSVSSHSQRYRLWKLTRVSMSGMLHASWLHRDQGCWLRKSMQAKMHLSKNAFAQQTLHAKGNLKTVPCTLQVPHAVHQNFSIHLCKHPHQVVRLLSYTACLAWPHTPLSNRYSIPCLHTIIKWTTTDWL